jgi:hypothetical protein
MTSSAFHPHSSRRPRPSPADGFAVFLEMLRRKGFSDEQLDMMAKQNPARLLGLP